MQGLQKTNGSGQSRGETKKCRGGPLLFQMQEASSKQRECEVRRRVEIVYKKSFLC